MKKFVTILTGIILTLPSAYSQENVFYSYITHGSCFGSHDVEILIPFGEQFIYERYRYFQYYTLVEKDTLNVDEKILKGKIVTTSFEYIDQECSFCDPRINKIRNSALIHKIKETTDNTAKKKIGCDNKEFIDFNNELIELTCSDRFAEFSIKWEQKVNEKIEEIYYQKKERKKWIASNYDKIDSKYIAEFLKTFNRNITDKESFLEIVISNHEDLINEIDKQEYPSSIYGKLKSLPKTEKLLRATKILRKSSLRGKTYRKVKEHLIKNYTEVDRGYCPE